MSYFYLLAFLPILVGLMLLAKNREVVWPEVLGSAALVFLLAGIFHFAAVRSQVGDYETWSGQISRSTHFPRWVERVETSVDDYDSKGNRTGSHTEVSYTTHQERWTADTTTDDDHEITRGFFQQISRNFNNLTTETPYKSGFHSGDRNIYVAYNRTGFVYPTNTWRRFENRLRSVPNLFQFAKVPSGIQVYPYPENRDWLKSDRLVGPIKSKVDQVAFDKMNSRLGPQKRVNVILVGFKNRDATAGHYQQSAWAGGKKNDLVLCYDATEEIPTWAFCFGWTEREVVKRNLESLVLEVGVTTAALPDIEREIAANYLIKDWHKFDYISIPPPRWSLVWFPIITVITQIGYWLWATNNQFSDQPRRWPYS